MREAQKAHFRTKSAADLEKAEALEKEVDGLTKAMLDVSKMYKIKHIEEGKSYTNIKTGEVYKVLPIAAAAWDTAQVLVVYQDLEQGPVWVRSMTEFSEKFTEEKPMTLKKLKHGS